MVDLVKRSGGNPEFPAQEYISYVSLSGDFPGLAAEDHGIAAAVYVYEQRRYLGMTLRKFFDECCLLPEVLVSDHDDDHYLTGLFGDPYEHSPEFTGTCRLVIYGNAGLCRDVSAVPDYRRSGLILYKTGIYFNDPV